MTKQKQHEAFMVISIKDLKEMSGNNLTEEEIALTEDQAYALYWMFKEAVIYRS